MSLAMDFLTQLFGDAEAPVYLCSLANDKDDPTEPDERHIATRDANDVEAFIAKWDRPKRGLFFCVSTIRKGQRRNKDNVSEICFLHADVDFRDVIDDSDTILRRLRALPLPPSLIVSSGNGLHCYWCFREPLTVNVIDGVETIERVEAALRLLADLVGGDMKVCQVAALLRLPGTHNSKKSEWKPVEIVHQSQHRYEPDDIEDILAETSPIVLRKLRPSPTADEINPFLRIAETLGYKPPIDVEKRLSAMIFMGGGDAAIHDTQISVTASLLNAGVEVDEVVSTVLAATRNAAGDYGQRWNWKREERNIRNMCATWQKKHPPKASTPASPSTPTGPAATVHNLSEARAKKEAKEPQPKSQKVIDRENMHIMIGQTMLKMLQDKGTPIIIVVDQLWRYENSLWFALDNKGRHALDSEIETCIRALGATSSLKLVAEVRGWFFRNPELYHETMEWDDHGKIAIRGGLIDAKTFGFESAKPEHHVTARIDCDYNAKAACPHWLKMLADMFADRNDDDRRNTISLIQEVLGTALIAEKSKALSRALVFHGISNTGKTDLIKTISGLLTDNPISTPLAALDSTHGLMEFTRNAPWVLHEAFDSQKWHFSSMVKSILSGDPVQINIKNGALISRRIRQPVIWGTNVPPQFKEATRAIINRMIVISCYTVFDPKEPVGVAKLARDTGFSEPSEMILATEKPGLLNWALAGLQRALKRGYFATTAEMDETLETVRTDSNIVAGFLDECADFAPNFMISTSDFCAAFSVWWTETKGEDRHVPSNDSIGRALVSYGDQRIATDTKELRDNKHRYYAGLHLNNVGLDYWSGASAEGLAKGKTARMSGNLNDVNRFVPPTWEDRSAIQKLLKMAVTLGGDTRNLKNRDVSGVTDSGDSSPRF